MTNRFMMTVAAAALIAGSGFGAGGGAGGAGGAGGGGGGAPPTQQSAPSSDRGAPSAAPMNRDSAAPTKGAESSEGAKGGAKNAQSKDGMSKDGMKDSAQSKDGMSKDGKSGSTTGNAATSATSAPPAEKRTQIVSAIRSEKSITETTNVNFNVSVGTRVPSSVHFHPLPPRIVEIYPEWRGYQVILVGGRYVIVRPQTHEIVYIIEG
jgi:hypothetical protein